MAAGQREIIDAIAVEITQRECEIAEGAELGAVARQLGVTDVGERHGAGQARGRAAHEAGIQR